jgi:hypothetical protein
MRFAFLLQGWGIASTMFGRTSFCVFLLHIAKIKPFVRWTLWFAITSQFLVNIAMIIVVYSQCGNHPQSLWDPSVGGKCLKPNVQTNISYFQCGQWSLII